MESRKAIALVVIQALPQKLESRVEKASFDEIFIDLSAQVHRTLLDGYPILNVPKWRSGEEYLPLPQRGADHVVGDQAFPIDWDEVALGIGASIDRNL